MRLQLHRDITTLATVKKFDMGVKRQDLSEGFEGWAVGCHRGPHKLGSHDRRVRIVSVSVQINDQLKILLIRAATGARVQNEVAHLVPTPLHSRTA